MPRIARKDLGTSFFHVIVQGVNKEYIFYKEDYINKYIELINKYSNNYEIEILAYCIMNNHAHLLIYTEDYREMSKFMHKVNGIYAQHYNNFENRVGILFRNRYVTEPIYKEDYLINCINYIHMNPVKANIVSKCEDYKYSTYNEYIKEKQSIRRKRVEQILHVKDLDKIIDEYYEDFIFHDIELDKESIFKFVIKKYEKETGKDLEQIINNKKILREIVRDLKENYKIPYSDIMKKFNISRGKFQYFLKNDAK